MKRVYLDSGVLIAAFRGMDYVSSEILKLLSDKEYEIYVSDAVWMEVFPKAKYNKVMEEVEFYEEIFKNCNVLKWNEEVLEEAKSIAVKYGLSAMDAFHVAFSLKGSVDKIITLESPEKPIFRVKEVKAVNYKNMKKSDRVEPKW